MRRRMRNATLLLAVLWAVLVAAVVDGARTGEIAGATAIVLLVLLTGLVPIFWRLLRRPSTPKP